MKRTILVPVSFENLPLVLQLPIIREVFNKILRLNLHFRLMRNCWKAHLNAVFVLTEDLRVGKNDLRITRKYCASGKLFTQIHQLISKVKSERSGFLILAAKIDHNRALILPFLGLSLKCLT